ncbi:hypothetical protein CH365_19885 [Leptospira neocaledonica]|uniref:Uncharacterized protein n=1 Tax=Leptospira neocaledonica TaxID=2023192 RepID=A0A2M9ZT65_9LEPT|nr:hypothetical protein CH365_19885 [Leptospira neocaledonica]
MTNFKYRWEQFLKHPELIQFVSDSKGVLIILFKLFSLLMFLSVIVPAVMTLLFWVDFSNSGSQRSRTLFEVIVIFFICFGYVANAFAAFISIFIFSKWSINILISYNLFIAITELLQDVVWHGSVNEIVYGITVSNTLIAILYYKIFGKSFKKSIDFIAHGD